MFVTAVKFVSSQVHVGGIGRVRLDETLSWQYAVNIGEMSVDLRKLGAKWESLGSLGRSELFALTRRPP